MSKPRRQHTLKHAALNCAGICLLAAACVQMPAARAADHNDAPGIMGAEGSQVDITDVFAFRSPTNQNNLVLAMAMFSPVAGDGLPPFSDRARYELYVDTDGDNAADTTIRTTVSNNADGSQNFEITGIPGAGGTVSGAVSNGTAAQVSEQGDAKAFVGLRDDHFYFDFTAFTAFVSAPCLPAAGLRCPGTGDPSNFFASFNTASIIVEFPATALPGIDSPTAGNLAVWAKTFTRE